MIHKLIIQDLTDIDSYLNELSLKNNLKWITPSPLLADGYRAFFDENEIESTTISKFCDEALTEINPNLKEKRKSKSEILLLLKAALKNFEDVDYYSFKKYFNLFTTIRSYSLDLSVMETVGGFYDEKTQNYLKIFHLLFEELEIFDEHQVFVELKNNIAHVDQQKTLVFAGFDYLNSVQIDFINELSRYAEIILPIYQDSWEGQTSMDWISWPNGEVVNKTQNKKTQELTIYEVPANSLPLALRSLPSGSIVIGEKNISIERLSEITLKNLNYKISTDYFADHLNEIKSLLTNNYVFPIQSEIFIKSLIEESKKLVNEEKYIEFKIYSQFIKTIKKWIEQSDKCLEISKSDFALLFEVMSLDLPRLSYSEFKQQDDALDLFCHSDLEFIKNKNVYYVVMSNYMFSPSGNAQSEKVEQYLASIGPVRRREFDLLNLKAKLKSFFRHNNVQLILEKDLISQSKELTEVLTSFEYKVRDVGLDFSTSYKSHEVRLEKKEKIFSSTKLQSYLDCPKKYYYQYVERKRKNIFDPLDITPLELGRIEHKVIERYFKEGERSVDSIIKSEFEKLCENKKITKIQVEKYLNEINFYSLNGIEFLKKLNLEFAFEVNFNFENDVKFTGQIDCLGQGGNESIVLDFKRSNSSFSTYQSIENFQKIQLWFYLKKIIESKMFDSSKRVAFGYVDLSKTDNSMIFFDDETYFKELKALGLGKMKYLKNYNELIEKYQKLEDELIKNINNDTEYIANPTSELICQYCDYNSICDRGFQ